MEIWCGDETLAQQYASMKLNPPPQAFQEHKVSASAFEADYYGAPIAQMIGSDLALIKVSGGLLNGSASWRRFYGMIGYEDVKAAVVEAVSKPEVKGILMYYDTHGGAVLGVESTARLLNEVKVLKPVVGFAAVAASAGYWLASTSEHIVAEQTSQLASLGSIIQLAELTDAHAKMGVKFHTFKSGALKMAGNPNEPMSEEAAAYFQTMVEDTTSIFYHAIAKNRGQDPTEMRKNFGDGRSVMGARALAGGLVDEIGGLGVAIGKLKSLVDARSTTANLQKL